MLMQIVRYKSGLEDEEVRRRFEERADRYRNVPGLLQKYYVRFAGSGDYAGIYLWDSAESQAAWKAGSLSDTLAQTYQVEGAPTRELADVLLVLNEGRDPL